MLRMRISELLNLSEMKLPVDYWWRVERAENINSVGNEITTIILGRVLPYLDGITSYESLQDKLAKRITDAREDVLSSIYLSIIKALLGDNHAAMAMLINIERTVNAAWKARIHYVIESMVESKFISHG